MSINLLRHVNVACLLSVLILLAGFAAVETNAQNAGGSPHDASIYGVKIGMDVPSALQSVYENAHRQPGQEKPDARKNEGRDNRDVRVLYKLKEGNLQIVFAGGKVVREIVFEYAKVLQQDDLKLLESTATFSNAGGETRRDDRYSVGFTSDDKKERFWWRDEKTDAGYRIRVGFVSGKLNKGGLASKEVTRKLVTVVPEDADKFAKSAAQ